MQSIDISEIYPQQTHQAGGISKGSQKIFHHFVQLYNSLTPNSTAQSAINIFKNPYSTAEIVLVTECYMEIQVALQNYFRSLYKE